MARYKITVVTGNVDSAGTDANVYIQLVGELGKADPLPRKIRLDNQYDNFERGRTDSFTVDAPDLTTLSEIIIGHDNSGSHPGWFLDRVFIHNEDRGLDWTGRANRWLARDEEDGRTEVRLPAVRGRDHRR